MKIKILPFILSILLLFHTLPVCAAVNLSAQYAATAHSAYEKNDFLKAGEYYEKAYQKEKNKIFLDNAVNSYLNHAFNSANEKKYDETVKYCRKILSINKDNQNAKELLSDIYYTRGSENFCRGNIPKAREDFNNSLKYAVIEEQEEKARKKLAMIDNPADEIDPSFSVIKPSMSYVPDTLPELLNLMEMKAYGDIKGKLPLIKRIQELEKDILNETYDKESLIVRSDRLRNRILPELANRSDDTSEDNNYISEIIEQSRGTARIFGKMPIYVYMEDGNTKSYKRAYKDAVKEAMKEWENAADGKIKFKISNNPSLVNLKIEWVDYFEDFAWVPELKKEDVCAKRQKIKYGKANTLVQIGSIIAMVIGGLVGVPAIGMIGSIGGGIASPVLQYKSLDLDDKDFVVNINTESAAGLSEEQAKEKIKQIALHQLGHAIGIYGHSPNPDDIMYGNFSAKRLSERDKNTIKEIYENVIMQEE